jgi:methionyl-tRNA synthetase
MGPAFFITLAIVGVWTLIWKGIGLWKAGRNKQLAWFVFIFILNTAGILPILYLAFFQKESSEAKMLRSLEKKLQRKK